MHYGSLAALRRRLYVGASVSVLAAIGLAASAHAADVDAQSGLACHAFIVAARSTVGNYSWTR